MISFFKQNKRLRIFPVTLSPTPSISFIPLQCVQHPPILQEKKEGKKLNPDPFQVESAGETEPGSQLFARFFRIPLSPSERAASPCHGEKRKAA